MEIIADFLLRKYFRFSDDVFDKWHGNFEILTNSLHEDLELIQAELSTF